MHMPTFPPGFCRWCQAYTEDDLCDACNRQWQDDQAAMDRESTQAQEHDYQQYWADLPGL